jgi:hypothetical protein
MPNRIIREAILDSERYHALSIDARCLYFELLLNADDYGLVPVGDLYLKRHCPSCEGKSAQAIAGLLEQIATQQMAVCYKSESGATFACIPKFYNWPRAFKPKWPLPPEPLLSEIKALQEKRSASATRVSSKRTASEHETANRLPKPLTEKKKNNTPPDGGPVDAAAEVFAFGVEFLTTAGLKPITEKTARNFLGSLVKQWPADTILAALRASLSADDPKAYAMAILTKKPTIGQAEPAEHWD